jgi:hypothetical protein
MAVTGPPPGVNRLAHACGARIGHGCARTGKAKEAHCLILVVSVGL